MKLHAVAVPAIVLACAVASGCLPTSETGRRSVTTIRSDPRPPEDSNQIPPPIPSAESTNEGRR